MPCGPLFEKEAEVALGRLKALRIVDAPESPTFGEACRQWSLDFAGALFGAYDSESGRRLITEFFLLISKKNIKSTLAAGIMMTALTLNWRRSAEFLILAPTIEVADNSFIPARDMIKEDDELRDLCLIQEHYRKITHRTTGATLKIVAADSESVGGKKATGILIDELWMFGKKPGAENMLREATGGLASRPEGFVVYLSTQSDEPPAGVFKQKLSYARSVRDGRIKDKKFLPLIYEFPDSMVDAKEHLKPDNFDITNPNMGLSVGRDFLERELGKAQEAGEESLRGFLAKHLNVEIGLALKTQRWAGADFWEQGASVLTLEELLSRSEVVVAGIDGGGLDDMFGLAVVGREAETGSWLHWAHAWIHPIVLKKRMSEAARFKDFADAGELTIIDTMGQDVDEAVECIERCEAAGVLDRVGVDQAGIGAVIDELLKIPLAEDRIVAIPQGWRMVGAIKTAERKLAQGALKHGGSSLMAWCVGNARVEARGNAVLITKQISGSAKIDPLMATLDAVALMAMNPKPRKKQFQAFFV